jgi:hypothetical protein
MSDLTDTMPTLPEHFTDEDLAALALAADPDQPLDPDAVPISTYLDDGSEDSGLLPGWYMAPPAKRHAHKGAQFVAIAVIAAFVIIEAFGLCSTYGQPLFH